MGKIGNNTLVVTLERILQLILGLFVTGLIARYLTVEDFALWQLALQLLPYVGIIGLICGAEVILPKLPNDIKGNIITNAFVLRAIFGLTSIGIGFIAIYFLSLPATFNIFATILLFTLLINEPFAVFACYLQSKTENIPLSIIRLTSVGVRTLIVIIVIYFQLDIFWLAFAWVLESFFVSIGYALCFKFHKSRNIDFQFNLIKMSTMKDLSSQGFLFMIGQLLLMTAMRSDRIIATKLTDFSFSGNYLAVTQLVDSIFQISFVINLVFVTSFLYNQARSFRQDLKITINLSIVYILVSLLGSVILFNCAEIVVDLIYGSSYAKASYFLKNIAFVLPLYTCSLLLNAYLFKKEMFKHYLLSCLVILLVTMTYLALVTINKNYSLLIYSAYIYSATSILITSILIMRSKNET